MQTAQAINALRHQEQTGQTILTEEVLAAGYPTVTASQVFREKYDREERRPFFGSLRERIVNALIQRNTQISDEILGEALAVMPPETLILEVIRPVMAEIGTLWEQGKIGVASEHLATNYLRHRMLMWMVSGPPARSQQPIVLACAPDEWHEGSLLIMGALLRRRLWPIVYLGQAVPLTDLGIFIRDTNPSFVVLIAMTDKSAANIVDLPQWIPDSFSKGRPMIGFGGLIFVEQPEWRSKVPGIYLGSTFEEGILTIEKLLR
jgi:methanogenic corrinoid protein MtbC1